MDVLISSKSRTRCGQNDGRQLGAHGEISRCPSHCPSKWVQDFRLALLTTAFLDLRVELVPMQGGENDFDGTGRVSRGLGPVVARGDAVIPGLAGFRTPIKNLDGHLLEITILLVSAALKR